MIYFVQCDIGGPIKIGYTARDVDGRVSSLQIGCPFKLILLATMQGTMLDEQNLHRRFAGWRTGGEWHSPECGGLVELLESLGASALPTRTWESPIMGEPQQTEEHWKFRFRRMCAERGVVPPLPRGPALFRAFVEKYSGGHRGSQRDLARELGVTDERISVWLNGKGGAEGLYASMIERWTSGAVPAESWLTVEDRLHLASVLPAGTGGPLDPLRDVEALFAEWAVTASAGRSSASDADSAAPPAPCRAA